MQQTILTLSCKTAAPELCQPVTGAARSVALTYRRPRRDHSVSPWRELGYHVIKWTGWLSMALGASALVFYLMLQAMIYVLTNCVTV